MMVSEQDCQRIAAEALLDVRTVRKAVNEQIRPRSPATVAAIIRAAEHLGVAVSVSLEAPAAPPRRRTAPRRPKPGTKEAIRQRYETPDEKKAAR